MAVNIDDLTPTFDAPALASIQLLAANGAINPKWYVHDGNRICCSLEPSGDNGTLEWHVSVSRNERPVPIGVAATYGRALVPAADGWDNISTTETATHIWSRM